VPRSKLANVVESHMFTTYIYICCSTHLERYMSQHSRFENEPASHTKLYLHNCKINNDN